MAKVYLNRDVLAKLDEIAFQEAEPFPWANPLHVIQPDGFAELLDSLPDLSRFRPFFGKQRKHGQAAHDRYVLDYDEGLELSSAWQTFIDELRSHEYRTFVCRLLGVPEVSFRFHWHFTPTGAEVSPHCDSRKKLGTHIFYLNTERDWEWSWGGETVLLDDGNRFAADSAPAFADFEAIYPAETTENQSLIFGRRGNSWHGVRQIDCPEDHYRKVFIVVFYGEKPTQISSSKGFLRRIKTRFLNANKARKVKTPRY